MQKKENIYFYAFVLNILFPFLVIKIFSVPNLNFLAYDKHSDKLVIMSGKDIGQNKILIYDLNGNLIKKILPPENGYFYDTKIDSIGYITVKCNKNNDIVYYELNGTDLTVDILRC